MHETEPIDTERGWVPYHYYPNVIAAGIFSGIFGICALLHAWRIFKFKAWYFIPFLIGTLAESIGYGSRIGNHYDLWNQTYFIMQTLLILLGPAFFAASIYMTLSRIAIALHGEQLLLIRPKFLTACFVTGDVLSIAAQGLGGGLLASGDGERMDLGSTVIKIGLFIQIFFFGGFIIMAVIFHLRLHKSSTHRLESRKGRKYFITMYIANALILIRSAFRLIEYIQGQDGELMSKEFYLYIFDGALMVIVVVGYLIVMPYGGIFDEWKRRKDLGDLELSRR
ncbi:hypothetical protein ABW19_dt0202167 [Dactylella cylindrospora]|nr:hypothetical protein ABW19_dt0202167 [Dactylella cylindrospora]